MCERNKTIRVDGCLGVGMVAHNADGSGGITADGIDMGIGGTDIGTTGEGISSGTVAAGGDAGGTAGAPGASDAGAVAAEVAAADMTWSVHDAMPVRRKSALAVAAVGLIAAGALLSGCGEPTAVPMDDEFTGDSGQSGASAGAQTPSDDGRGNGAGGNGADGEGEGSDTASGKRDTGEYGDGTYAITGQYGPVGEDSIDVTLTVADQRIADVSITGHPFTAISRTHQEAFSKAIPGVVVGKPLKDLQVDTVAGASWTTDAFNKALEVARQEASIGG